MSALASCRDCGRVFARAEGEAWKVRCLSCYSIFKAGRAPVATPPAADPVRTELRDRLRALLMLTHPDKHNGSRLANDTTAWLLSVRERIGAAQ